MNDPELRAEVVKLSSEEPDPTEGEEAQKIVADMYATPEAVGGQVATHPQQMTNSRIRVQGRHHDKGATDRPRDV